MTSIFFEINPKTYLCFFQPQIDFRTQIFFFEKKCMQNLIFCVYNVVLDVLILDFSFLFSTLETPLPFVLPVFVCLYQCLVT